MLMKKLFFPVVTFVYFTILSWTAVIAEPPREGLYAWYQEDGVSTQGVGVSSWESAINRKEVALDRVVGKPRLVRVSTPSGNKSMIRFQSAALWQSVQKWGTLTDPRTIIVYAKLPKHSEGVLFDGSTRKGMSPCRWKGNRWETTGKVKVAETPNTWQPHTFVYEQTSSALGGFIVGANVATEEKLTCDIAEILVYARVLNDGELEQAQQYLKAKWGEPQDLPASEQPSIQTLPQVAGVTQRVIRTAGDDGVDTYRIPGLATTKQGTLIAVFDARNRSGADLPGDIDVGMMRSTDNGDHWSPMKRIIDFDASIPGSQGNGVGDPAVLTDQRTGTIFVAALWSQGGRAWHGSGPGLKPEETGQFVLVKSTDDGLTWSPPINITQQVKNPAWRLCFNGPGNGIQLTDGSLVFPAQYRDENAMAHSCFIASRDGGEIWKISPPAIPSAIPTSESAIAQLEDGSLLLSMRNESRAGIRAWARWEWKEDLLNGKWSEPWYVATEPTCMASLIRGPRGNLLFSNPNHPQRRVALTVRQSQDGGKSWDEGRVLEPNGAMYSCMTVLRDGRIGILYESAAAEGLVFARFEP